MYEKTKQIEYTEKIQEKNSGSQGELMAVLDRFDSSSNRIMDLVVSIESYINKIESRNEFPSIYPQPKEDIKGNKAEVLSYLNKLHAKASEFEHVGNRLYGIATVLKSLTD